MSVRMSAIKIYFGGAVKDYEIKSDTAIGFTLKADFFTCVLDRAAHNTGPEIEVTASLPKKISVSNLLILTTSNLF